MPVVFTIRLIVLVFTIRAAIRVYYSSFLTNRLVQHLSCARLPTRLISPWSVIIMSVLYGFLLASGCCSPVIEKMPYTCASAKSPRSGLQGFFQVSFYI